MLQWEKLFEAVMEMETLKICPESIWAAEEVQKATQESRRSLEPEEIPQRELLLSLWQKSPKICLDFVALMNEEEGRLIHAAEEVQDLALYRHVVTAETRLPSREVTQLPEIREFTAVLVRLAGTDSLYLEVPFAPESVFGPEKRALRATIDRLPCDTVSVRRKADHSFLRIAKALREKLGKVEGDTVQVTMTACRQEMLLTVEGYLQRFRGHLRRRLECLRELVLSVRPGITEKMAWGMPSYFYQGKLVHFEANEHCIRFYPGPDALESFRETLAGLRHTQSAVQLPHNKPLPVALVRDIVAYQISVNEAQAAQARNGLRPL